MTAATASGLGEPARLPELRGELRIAGPGDEASGAHVVIFDPVRQRYFQVDAETAGLLSLLPRCGTAEELCACAADELGLVVGKPEIEAFLLFLEANGLTMPTEAQSWRRLAAAERSARPGWLTWAIHNYLFIRQPLVAPERFLRACLPWVAPLFTRTCAIVVATLGLAGLYLVARQWEAFAGTFPHLLSLEGAALYAVALVIVKSLHELGHAFAAVRFGCRVPAMGVCLMVLCPMLYTDVSDAAKLASRRQRVAIGAAGLVVETALAAIATFLWAFLPEGPWRSLAFAVATTGWLLSLGLNLNPFMRFDGYYILADLTGIDNLQPRAFAIGRWQLREWLFGLGAPPPEPMPVRWRRWLALYAFATWIYRLVVFTGIALLVYTLAFKLLGIALFAIEIVFFVAMPIWHEIREWHRMRTNILATRRTLATLGALAALLALILVPWSSRVDIPAIVEDADIAQLYPVRAGRVVAIGARLGTTVAAGDLIVELESLDLEQEVLRTRLRLKAVALRLARRAADPTDRAEGLVLEDMRRSLAVRLAGLEAEQAELRIVAPAAGVVAEIEPALYLGRWLQRTDRIALIRGTSGLRVRGYVSEEDLDRLDPSASARLVPEDALTASIAVRLAAAAPAGVTSLDILELASPYGGSVPARPLERGREGRLLAPIAGQYLVTGTIEAAAGGFGASRVARGTIIGTGRAESFAARAWRRVLKVLVRESGA